MLKADIEEFHQCVMAICSWHNLTAKGIHQAIQLLGKLHEENKFVNTKKIYSKPLKKGV
jgi:hypothetical protein